MIISSHDPIDVSEKLSGTAGVQNDANTKAEDLKHPILKFSMLGPSNQVSATGQLASITELTNAFQWWRPI